MKVPELFYGSGRQASTKVRAFAKAMAKSRDYANFNYGPLLDTRDVPGSILVNKEFVPSSRPNFHCYLLSEFLVDFASDHEVHHALEMWLRSSLNELSRFLCTLGGLSWWGLQHADPYLARQYAEAAVTHWDTIKGEQERFGPVVTSEETLLHIWITLFYAVEKLGLRTEERFERLGVSPDVLLRVTDEVMARRREQ